MDEQKNRLFADGGNVVRSVFAGQMIELAVYIICRHFHRRQHELFAAFKEKFSQQMTIKIFFCTFNGYHSMFLSGV